MFRRFILLFLVLLVLLAAALMTALFIFRYLPPSEFRQATASQPVRLPDDEAAHFDVSTEWWYYTGFLTGEDEDCRYGFELVFFKAFVPSEVRIGQVLPVNWVSNPLYFAHFAVSDLSAEEHVFFERANFPKFWAADASKDRYDVRNGDWRAWTENGTHHLRAGGGRYALRLTLEPAKPAVLHGPGGTGVLSMGEAGPSYYYSFTDLDGLGLLYVDGKRQVVEASAWMDHQWGSWSSHTGFAGWDWFSLRLEDHSQIMLFNFRDHDWRVGEVQSQSSGTWIAADGTSQHLRADDYDIQVLEQWTSPSTGATYPVKWLLTVPERDVEVTLQAAFPGQEMSVRFGPVYWEGVVSVEGTVSGNGFVEMTGYAGQGH